MQMSRARRFTRALPRGRPPLAESMPGFCVLLKGNILSTEKLEIVVRGTLGPSVLAAMEGFEVSYCTDGLTHLIGTSADQAKIHGLFRILSDLNIELISVNPVIDPDLAQP
jgi:hypothetical protein